MLKWKLPQLLKDEGITAYALDKHLKEKRAGIATGTVYRWAKEMPQTIDSSVLEAVIKALVQLSKKRISVSDIFDVQ